MNLKKDKNLELLFTEQTVTQREDVNNVIVCYIPDEKFMICTNSSCGIIYNDCLDRTAEWRYYGADDNNTRDPTRCGMPINPLLKGLHMLVKFYQISTHHIK